MFAGGALVVVRLVMCPGGCRLLVLSVRLCVVMRLIGLMLLWRLTVILVLILCLCRVWRRRLLMLVVRVMLGIRLGVWLVRLLMVYVVIWV